MALEMCVDLCYFIMKVCHFLFLYHGCRCRILSLGVSLPVVRLLEREEAPGSLGSISAEKEQLEMCFKEI